jgi:hypothetical protein
MVADIGKNEGAKMTDNGITETQEHDTQLRSKRGFIRYEKNPSVPDKSTLQTRTKRVRIGDEQKGMFIGNDTGEVLGQGAAVIYEFEEVETTRFVKLYLSGIKQAAGLSKAGLAVFELVYRQLQDNQGTDQIGLSHEQAKRMGLDISERVFRNGVRDLLEREFLYESLVSGLFFINIRYMFNGDRLAFVKGYKRKGATTKPTNQLDLFAAPADALPDSEGEE